MRASVRHRSVVSAALLVTSMGLTACDSMYSRDVTARVAGPPTVRVGETVRLAVTMAFSDGTVTLVQPSQTTSIVFESSNTGVLTVSAQGDVRGVAPGVATVTATPSVTSTGTGKRTAGTIAITVVP